jgi:hypothetical protein
LPRLAPWGGGGHPTTIRQITSCQQPPADTDYSTTIVGSTYLCPGVFRHFNLLHGSLPRRVARLP